MPKSYPLSSQPRLSPSQPPLLALASVARPAPPPSPDARRRLLPHQSLPPPPTLPPHPTPPDVRAAPHASLLWRICPPPPPDAASSPTGRRCLTLAPPPSSPDLRAAPTRPFPTSPLRPPPRCPPHPLGPAGGLRPAPRRPRNVALFFTAFNHGLSAKRTGHLSRARAWVDGLVIMY